MKAIAAGAAPAHALYFTVYEKFKFYLTGGRQGHFPVQHCKDSLPIRFVLAPVCADGIRGEFGFLENGSDLYTVVLNLLYI